MAAISDKTIIGAILSMVEGTATLFDESQTDNSKLHRVFCEPQPGELKRIESNYMTIIPPLADAVEVLDDDSQMGNAEMTERPFNIIFTFKRITRTTDDITNNDRIYDAVKNFRDAVRADTALSSANVIRSWISPWGYAINEEDQTVVGGAIMVLNVQVSEVF